MQPHSPSTLPPRAAARTLEGALAGKGHDFTIADAAARSGLALRDAESGLHALVHEYRGHLRVTEDGDLLFRFPTGFTKPWELQDSIGQLGKRAGRAALGVGRFIVRAWISVVLLGYALVFAALILALLFGSRDDSRGSRGGLGFGYVLFRVVLDALFWTFHPFSPFAYGEAHEVAPGVVRPVAEPEPTSFYEKVNHFFFGPEIPEPDPRAMERRIVAEIRAQRGRIGLGDVIRVTGLPREQADPLMSRLLLDYEGEVDVSEEGGIFYTFAALRKTVEDAPAERPKPIWAQPERLVPLTGNTLGANLMIAALNGFNLLASYYVIQQHLTFEKIAWLFQSSQHPTARFEPPPTGTAVALGWVPFAFSFALFVLPMFRAAWQPVRERRVALENGRRAMLREILDHQRKGEVTDESLRDAWREAAGKEPDDKSLTREIVALGGDVDYEAGKVRYRFPDFEAEAKALEAEREAAAEQEARVGNIVFSSES